MSTVLVTGRTVTQNSLWQIGLGATRLKCLIKKVSLWPGFKRCQWVDGC